MVTVAEHTYEETLLPEKANILDIGCRGFLFTDEMQRRGHRVIPVDCDILIEGRGYTNVAVTDHDGWTFIQRSKDPQATRISKVGFEKVECMKLSTISKNSEVDIWDLIKIDIEGSEYEVIMSLTEPPAKQLSIEFHLHTKAYGDAQVKEMEDKLLSLGYFPAKHDKTSQHGMGMNYWDSCWILNYNR